MLYLKKNRIAETIQKYQSGKKVVIHWLKKQEEEHLGHLWFNELPKEDVLKKWQDCIKDDKLNVREYEEVISIKKKDKIKVISIKDEYESEVVIFAIGKYGSLKKLGIEGENKKHVLYRLKD